MLEDYWAKLTYVLNKRQSLPQTEHREIQKKDSLKPSSAGKASIIWAKDMDNESWTCRLLLLAGGQHLCLQTSASNVNNFGGFPFNSSSEFELLVSDFTEIQNNYMFV